MAEFHSKIKTIEWVDNYSKMVDQTVLPYEFKYVKITTGQGMFDAIKTMIVRGAPAIGVAGAHGVVLYAQELAEMGLSRDEFVKQLIEKADYMATSRPTAVNLMWACAKQKEIIENSKSDIEEIVEELKQNAIRLENEDIAINKKIGDYGAEVVPKGATILTHCNAGGLATVGYGTALGVVRSAFANDPTIQVFADETRPRQQGARITTFELTMDGIPTTLITDGMCSYLMKNAKLILTDSGGIQEEAPSFGCPTLVMRYETERQEGIDAGVSVLVGADYDKIVSYSENILSKTREETRLKAQNPYGDGTSSKKIEEIISKY